MKLAQPLKAGDGEVVVDVPTWPLRPWDLLDLQVEIMRVVAVEGDRSVRVVRAMLGTPDGDLPQGLPIRVLRDVTAECLPVGYQRDGEQLPGDESRVRFFGAVRYLLEGVTSGAADAQSMAQEVTGPDYFVARDRPENPDVVPYAVWQPATQEEIATWPELEHLRNSPGLNVRDGLLRPHLIWTAETRENATRQQFETLR